jgi:hypothetical protein
LLEIALASPPTRQTSPHCQAGSRCEQPPSQKSPSKKISIHWTLFADFPDKSSKTPTVGFLFFLDYDQLGLGMDNAIKLRKKGGSPAPPVKAGQTKSNHFLRFD